MSGRIVEIGIIGCGQWEVLRSIRIYNELNKGREYLEVIGYFDDDEKKVGKEFGGYKVLGRIDDLSDRRYENMAVINNVRKDCQTRKKVVSRLKTLGVNFFPFAVLPDVDVEKDNISLGEGVEINEHTYIGHDTHIGNHVVVCYRVTIAHENYIGDYSFIAPGAVFAGRVRTGEGCFIGTGAVIIPNMKIGEWSVVGAGSVVMSDVPPYSTVMGNPARVVYRKDRSV